MGATAGCPAQTEFPLTGRHQGGRKGPFGQPERHQGGKKGLIGQLARHQGGRKGSIGQLARHQGGRKEPFGSLQGTREAGKDSLDSLRGSREAPGRQERPFGQLGKHKGGKDQLDSPEAPRRQERIKSARHQGGRKEPFGLRTRETCSTGLPIESRFWKGAGFCLTFNTISMANGPVRGKSGGGRHGRLPSAD